MVVSYLDVPSMEFKEQGSKRYYRGASIGYGNRMDRTSDKKQPGVGEYFLPSIFDRY